MSNGSCGELLRQVDANGPMPKASKISDEAPFSASHLDRQPSRARDEPQERVAVVPPVVIVARCSSPGNPLVRPIVPRVRRAGGPRNAILWRGHPTDSYWADLLPHLEFGLGPRPGDVGVCSFAGGTTQEVGFRPPIQYEVKC